MDNRPTQRRCEHCCEWFERRFYHGHKRTMWSPHRRFCSRQCSGAAYSERSVKYSHCLQCSNTFRSRQYNYRGNRKFTAFCSRQCAYLHRKSFRAFERMEERRRKQALRVAARRLSRWDQEREKRNTPEAIEKRRRFRFLNKDRISARETKRQKQRGLALKVVKQLGIPIEGRSATKRGITALKVIQHFGIEL